MTLFQLLATYGPVIDDERLRPRNDAGAGSSLSTCRIHGLDGSLAADLGNRSVCISHALVHARTHERSA